jgi:hypothetical protein
MVFNGMSTGLNRDRGNAGKASICLTDDAVIVGWEGGGLLSKASAERFEYGEIMSVADGDAALTGIQGAAARKNASSPIGRMMGHTGSAPAVFLTTRRGDITVNFGHKERGVAREAMVAIGDQLESRSR